MFWKLRVTCIPILALLAISATPTFAQDITGATVNLSCSSYAGSFTTEGLTVGHKYEINWLLFGLVQDTVDNSLDFTPTSSSESVGPTTVTMTTLNGTFTPNSTATLVDLTTGVTFSTDHSVVV